MPSHRKERLEELIKRTVSEAILKEIKDPRIGFVTISRVELKRDYSIADIWFSVIGDEKDRKRSIDGMKSACGFIQYIVGKNIRLRNTPRIELHLDDSIEKGVRMVNLLENLKSDIDA